MKLWQTFWGRALITTVIIFCGFVAACIAVVVEAALRLFATVVAAKWPDVYEILTSPWMLGVVIGWIIIYVCVWNHAQDKKEGRCK